MANKYIRGYLKTHFEEFSFTTSGQDDGGEFLIYHQSEALSRPRTRTMNGEERISHVEVHDVEANIFSIATLLMLY